jgi:DNA anti-recombination protein RmuC
MFNQLASQQLAGQEIAMGYAEDRSRMRREIEEMRSSRMALKKRLHHFAADLRQAMNHQRSSMRDHHVEQTAKTRDAMASFVANIRSTTHDMLGGFQRERHNAHRGWMRMTMHTGHTGGRKAG